MKNLRSFFTLILVLSACVFSISAQSVSSPYGIAVSIAYEPMKEKWCSIFSSAVEVLHTTSDWGKTGMAEIRQDAENLAKSRNPNASIITKSARKQVAFVYYYEYKIDAYPCRKKSYAVGFGDSLIEAQLAAEKEARLYCKKCQLQNYQGITASAPFGRAENKPLKNESDQGNLKKVETPITPQIPDPNSLVVPGADASKMVKTNPPAPSTDANSNSITGVKVNPDTTPNPSRLSPSIPATPCNEYTLNWYKGYYSESGVNFPLKVTVKNAVFSRQNSENGVPLYVIHLQSSQLIEGVSKYDVVLLIPVSSVQINREIDITDNNLTEELEGAVGRFRYGIGANVGDNFWSNADAGRNRIVGKIRITQMDSGSLSATFNLTAFATGFGGSDDADRKKYAEIQQGCFTATAKNN